MKITKFLSVFLVLLMLCTTVLSSCGQTPEETTTAVTTETEEPTTATESQEKVTTVTETTEETTTAVTTETEEPTTATESQEKVTTATETTEEQSSAVTEIKTNAVTTEDVTETESYSEEATSEETSSEETTETVTETEEVTTEEETTVITDVMIGETIDAEYATDFTVAKIFSNDMVVQRGEHIRVWGFAPESENGKKVSGEFKGMFAEALIENGEWCIKFGARLEADTVGAEMKIYAGENKTVTFTGVLVGDVYLVMGQSNAAYEVNSHLTYTDPATQGGGSAAIDENSIIRLNYLNNSGGSYTEKGSDYVYPDLENTKAWTKTTLTDTVRFSAIGYYFAKAMVEKSNNTVPVGLIEVAKGGAPLGSFLPNDLAEEYDSDYYVRASDLYYTHRSSQHMGRYLYNCYLAPVSRYAVAGIVWYQGESDNPENFSRKYCEIFNAFIERLRSTHNVINKDFPVFVTELAPIYTKPADYSGSQEWAYMETGAIRAYMGQLPLVVDNCYIGSSSDLWNNRTFWNNLHPNCKFEQANRLANMANAVMFGNGTLENAMGPIFKSANISADKKTVVITFTNVGDGLTTADGGVAVNGIIGLINKSYAITTVQPVSATITAKDQITVVFDTEVKAVAYNYNTSDCYGETVNLCNSAKIPAPAFITPYAEKPLTDYAESGFIKDTDTAANRVDKRVDTLTADGEELFTQGSIESKLAAVNNTVTVLDGTSVINVYGWVGFKQEILKFGYSVDGGNAIFNSEPIAPGSAVITAGGQYAKRYSVNMLIGDLALGEHTLTLLALTDLNGGTAIKLLTFKVVIKENVIDETAPTWSASGSDLNSIMNNGAVTSRDSDGNLVVTNGTTGTADNYVRFIDVGTNGKTATGRYLVITVKANNSNSKVNGIYTQDSTETQWREFGGVNIHENVDQWVTIIVDMSLKHAADSSITVVRVDCCEKSTQVGDRSVTFKSVEIYDNLDAALASAVNNILVTLNFTVEAES